MSATVTLVAFITPVLFTTIVKLTRVLLPTTVTLAVLTTVKLVYATVTLNWSLTTVLFSLQYTSTTFVQLIPTAFDLAITHNSVDLPPFNLSIIHVTFWPSVTLPALTLTNSNPSGKISVTLIWVALAIPVLFTTIVNLTKVLLATKVTFAVLLTVNMTGIALIDAELFLRVLFSLQVTLTVFVKVPLAMTFNVIVNTCDSPGLIKPTVNTPVVLL